VRMRTYSELSRLPTFEERFRYLDLRGQVGDTTFGFDRWINQRFYRSREWRYIRNHVIARDLGCDLGVDGYEIHVDPEFLITTTHNTHNAIHYGNERLLPRPLAARGPGDTQLWSRSR
jgi:hypothetical protein